ncbi:MAG TPA: Gfo/Idh/MocA family oxidoreductase [Bryobacteraceae bacterium]|nr:Gfo/Idh/MocA family oxidoreductase [Bryobacteraceae bacterium]
MIRAAIIGCGLIGAKRARACREIRIVSCCDVDEPRAAALAHQVPGADVSTDWKATVARPDVDLVFVATVHDMLAPIAAAAASAGKHVFVEKPAARSKAELEPVMEAARRTGALVRVGFNHRYHPAFRKAREIFESGALGKMMYVRGRYGHGGRPGYDQEWRAIPEKSGGGELVDQGMHLIDLSRWFLGDFSEVRGFTGTYFWNMPVEDNAFLLLRTPAGQVASLHATWTEWKNLFSFEICGRDAKLEITGLGGSYGVERLAYYRMLPEMGPPDTTIWEYPMADDSWREEVTELVADIRLNRQPSPGLPEAAAAWEIVETIYREAHPDHHQ